MVESFTAAHAMPAKDLGPRVSLGYTDRDMP
jgi:hypothetical protein